MERFGWPNPMQGDPTQRDQSRFCDYHRDIGRRLNHFCSLKYLVEGLIGTGHLKDFVKGPQPEQPNVQQTPAPTNTLTNQSDTRPMINVIHGRLVDKTWESKS